MSTETDAFEFYTRGEYTIIRDTGVPTQNLMEWGADENAPYIEETVTHILLHTNPAEYGDLRRSYQALVDHAVEWEFFLDFNNSNLVLRTKTDPPAMFWRRVKLEWLMSMHEWINHSCRLYLQVALSYPDGPEPLFTVAIPPANVRTLVKDQTFWRDLFWYRCRN